MVCIIKCSLKLKKYKIMRFLLIVFGVLFFSKEVLLAQETLSKDRELLYIQQINLKLLDNQNNTNNGLNLKKDKDYQVVVSQIGNNNILDIKGGLGDVQNVIQKGNRNYYDFIDYYNSDKSNMNILQEGKANSLHVYGTNSFTDNIKILQKSDYKTIK